MNRLRFSGTIAALALALALAPARAQADDDKNGHDVVSTALTDGFVPCFNDKYCQQLLGACPAKTEARAWVQQQCACVDAAGRVANDVNGLKNDLIEMLASIDYGFRATNRTIDSGFSLAQQRSVVIETEIGTVTSNLDGYFASLAPRLDNRQPLLFWRPPRSLRVN